MHQIEKKLSNEFAITFICLVLAVSLYLFYYPAMYTTVDESDYLSQSLILKHGTFFADIANVNILSSYNNGHIVPVYGWGQPFLLFLATSLFHWKTAFLVNLISHLINFFILRSLLRKFGVNPLWSLLYLLHPVPVYYTRTLLSDVSCATGILLATYCWHKKGKWLFLVGFFLGYATLIRVTGALAILCLVGLSVYSDIQNSCLFRITKSQTMKILLGLLPFVAIIFLINYSCHGNPFAVGYTAGNSDFVTEHFAIRNFLKNLPFYLLSLTLVLPLQVVGLFRLRKTGMAPFILISWAYILFYSFYYWHDRGMNWLQTLVLGQRFIIPSIVTMFVPYASWLDHVTALLRRRWSALVIQSAFLFTLGIFIIGLWGLHFTHQRYLNRLSTIRDELYRQTKPEQLIIGPWEAAKLFNDAFGMGKRNVNVWTEGSIKDPMGELFLRNHTVSLVFLKRTGKLESGQKLRTFRDELIAPFTQKLEVFQLSVPIELSDLTIYEISLKKGPRT